MTNVAPRPTVSAPNTTFDSLTVRESELLRKAGDRIFALSRRLSEAERSVQRLEQELSHSRDLLEETRRSRDVLSDQVRSMQGDLEREFVERSELRRLLASLQVQFQTHFAPPAQDARPRLGQGRESPQRGSAESSSSKGVAGRMLRAAVREFRPIRKW